MSIESRNDIRGTRTAFGAHPNISPPTPYKPSNHREIDGTSTAATWTAHKDVEITLREPGVKPPLAARS